MRGPIKCGSCKSPIEEPRGRQEFCPRCAAEAKREHQKQTALSRKTEERVRKELDSRRGFLAQFVRRPLLAGVAAWLERSEAAGRQIQAAEKVSELERLLVTRGPDDAHARRLIRAQAAELLLLQEFDGGDTQVAARSHELLRDVGEEGPLTSQKIDRVQGHSLLAIDYYLDAREYVDLARALIARANVFRLAGGGRNELHGQYRIRAARTILDEKCRANGPKIALVKHQAKLWEVRAAPQNRLTSLLAELRELAEAIDATSVWIETLREEVGGYARLRRFETAEARLDEMKTEVRRHPSHPRYVEPTLLTPEIQLLLDRFECQGHQRHRDKALDLITGRYRELYEANPHGYYHHRLLRWDSQHGLGMSWRIPNPTYSSPVLIYMRQAWEAVA